MLKRILSLYLNFGGNSYNISAFLFKINSDRLLIGGKLETFPSDSDFIWITFNSILLLDLNWETPRKRSKWRRI